MAKYAKKKKKSKSSKPVHRRRRSMGAMALNPSSDLVMYGSIAAGFLFGGKINPQIDKIVDPTKVDQKLVAAGQVGLGSAYLFLKKGKKNLLLTLASGVMVGAGAKRALSAFGIGAMALTGYQSLQSVSGYQNVHAVSGNGKLPKRIGNGMGIGFNQTKVAIGTNGRLENRMRA